MIRPLLLCAAVCLLAVGCEEEYDTTPIQRTPRDPTTPKRHASIQMVGRFTTNAMLGLSCYVTEPNREDLQKFCDSKRNSLGNRNTLKIHFFDDREHTPKLAGRYYFPESSDAHLVADYWFNKRTGESRLNAHKSMPRTPPEIEKEEPASPPSETTSSENEK